MDLDANKVLASLEEKQLTTTFHAKVLIKHCVQFY